MSVVIAGRDRVRRSAIIAASLLGHGLVLVLLGLTTPALHQAPLPDLDAVPIEVWSLSPREQARHRHRTAARRLSPVTPRRAASAAPSGAVAPPLTALSRLASPGPEIGDRPPAAPGARLGDLARALRGSPVGCANRDAVGLTRREREACDDAFGRRSVQTTDIAAPIDPAKRAAWNAVAARREVARRRKEAPPPPGVDLTGNAGGTRTNGIGILGY